jgi:hypothetical protein
MSDPIPLSRNERIAAIDADGGNPIHIDDGISSYYITPAYVGFDHVDMIDLHLAQLKVRGWKHQPTVDALLDARGIWSALERQPTGTGDSK